MSGYSNQRGGSGGGAGGRQNYDDGLAYGYGERVPGARRQKVMGYLRAANELRQSYQNTISSRYLGDEDTTPPGGFPEMDVVRSGDEEMLLFPSYARKHVKRDHADQPDNSGGSMRNGQYGESRGDSGDVDYWRREWEKHEDQNAVVDVDVRGWIYSPQKGPLTRRNRLLLAVARRLSGIPAPDQSPASSRDSSLHRGFRSRVHDSIMSQEEEAAAREAEIIARHGQREAEAASNGNYSSESTLRIGRTDSVNSFAASGDDERSTRRTSWNLQPSEMSREDLLKANDELMTRLRPFMTLPLAGAPITVFFYNDQKSQSKSITTDESGHFNLRAALDFVPTKVRVLASEHLSAVEDVIVTDSRGVSLVSDIDDTIKHSAIASGAKEIFKNTFIRELGDLTIQGVKEWYTRAADLGVKLHYVSNSPWQLYPLLKSYFKLAGLPAGSIHLKQYSGMLQGIFEPAAERKKGSLERIMHDFPERKFILVGDSGEADLEVYTDIVLANPGRVLGVFIRDVTTAEKKHFGQYISGADSSDNESGPYRPNQPSSRPALPARPHTMVNKKSSEDLIDFSDDSEPRKLEKASTSPTIVNDMDQLRLDSRAPGQPPSKPAKPSNLRSFSTTSQSSPVTPSATSSSTTDTKRTPPPPPKPRRPNRTIETAQVKDTASQRPPFSSSRQNQYGAEGTAALSRTSSMLTQSSTTSTYSSGSDDGYLASARRQLATAYNALPPIRSQSPARIDGSSSPPRRGLSSYPAAAARWAAGTAYGETPAAGDGVALYNKKEEMWKRRWARSEDIMKRHGVVLRSWRVGSDVMDDCIRLIEKAKAG